MHVFLCPPLPRQGIAFLSLEFPDSCQRSIEFGLQSLGAGRQCIQVVRGLPLQAPSLLSSGCLRLWKDI